MLVPSPTVTCLIPVRRLRRLGRSRRCAAQQTRRQRQRRRAAAERQQPRRLTPRFTSSAMKRRLPNTNNEAVGRASPADPGFLELVGQTGVVEAAAGAERRVLVVVAVKAVAPRLPGMTTSG